MKPKIFSFFSGIGFLDLGFEYEDFQVCYINEPHAPFLSGYKYARKHLGLSPPEFGYFEGSISELLEGRNKRGLAAALNEARANGSPVGFIGGPPCPDFSVGGKNRGRTGENGVLSQIFVDLICANKPDYFLFENVKGLLNTAKHREYYNELKHSLSTNGYTLTDKLINAIEYSVPQDRERILLFGVSNRKYHEKCQPFSKPKESDSVLDWNKYSKYPNRQAFDFPWPGATHFEVDSTTTPPPNIPLEITVEHWFNKNDVYNHPNSIHYFKPRAGLRRFLTVDEGDDSRKSYKRLHRWRYSPTAAYGNNEVHLHPYKARRLSVAEALAIQSLPKEFELPESMTLTDMFKSIGNGVPFLASRMIAKLIKEFLKDD